jgi:hypothetical protein
MLVSWRITNQVGSEQIYEAYNNTKGLRPGDLVLFRIKDNEKKVGVFLGNDLGTGKAIIQQPNASVEIPPESKDFVQPKFTLPNIDDFISGKLSSKPEKTESEKIADSIATVLISLSLVIFVGFVMRVVLVFTRYYMQLATDYDNQKIAYLLSKHEQKEFGTTLEELRSNKINFEKDSFNASRKIILGLVETLKGNHQTQRKTRKRRLMRVHE